MNEPNLRQYLIDHTVVLNLIAKDLERMQQIYEEMRQRKAKSVRSWDVCAVETDAEESECRDSVSAVVLAKGKAKTASVDTEDQGPALTRNLILCEGYELILL